MENLVGPIQKGLIPRIFEKKIAVCFLNIMHVSIEFFSNHRHLTHFLLFYCFRSLNPIGFGRWQNFLVSTDKSPWVFKAFTSEMEKEGAII